MTSCAPVVAPLSSSFQTNFADCRKRSQFAIEKLKKTQNAAELYRGNRSHFNLPTGQRTVKSTVTPSATPFSTSTYDSLYSYDDDLELVYAYYSQNAVAETDLEPDRYASDYTSTRTTTEYTYTIFYMPVTYTAPSSCSSQFTWNTSDIVSVPTEVRDQMTPVSTALTTVLGDPTVTWYISAGAAPTHSESDYYYTSYIENCRKPYSYSSGGGGSGGGGSSNLEVCSWYSGCTSIKTWVIIIATILPSLFVFGFIESYFWFRRLMLGKGCLRFGTICWIMISLWVACFTRSQSARSPEDQKLLREKWNQTGSWEAFKLWWKWGFRHSYPVPLLGQYSPNTVGIVPAGQPLPAPGTIGGGYYPGGPGIPPAYPSGVPQGAMAQNGQPYMYPPPQGWSPAPNGQGYPVPLQGQAYMPPPQSVSPLSYADQSKEATIVTENPTTPQQAPQPVPSPPANAVEAPSPVTHVAEAPSQPHQPPAQLPGDLPEHVGPANAPPPPKQN